MQFRADSSRIAMKFVVGNADDIFVDQREVF